MVSLPVVIAVTMCLFVSAAHEIHEVKVSPSEMPLDFLAVEEEIVKNGEKEFDVASQDAACDCGPNSKGCKIAKNGTKVCECEYHFRQENGVCKDWCDDNWWCDNGGDCVKESCQCLPGTHGPFCKIVDACEGIKGPLLCGDPNKMMCRFDEKTQKPYCECRIYNSLYDPKTRNCVECDCGKDGSCSLVDGKKTCKCNEGAALRREGSWGLIEDKCVACDCGENSDGCSFDGYDQVCNCKKGFAQQPDLYGDKCNECDCGPHGKGHFQGWYMFCTCDEGYAAFLNINRTELTCKECDCGKNGKCSFEKEVKQCKCNPGYALRDGICTACQCYAEDETVPCTFNNNIQKCQCPKGYEETKFICKDINECFNSSSNSCPETTKCFNTRGSYACICKEGYTPIAPNYDIKKDGCEDINECENENLCPRNHTICINLPGNYSCTCEKGYEPVPPYFTPVFGGCQKEKEKKDDSSPWKTVLIVIGILMCSCILAFLVLIVVRRNSRRSPLRTESTMHDLR